jgi:CheY-like chemotaxis protein
MIDRTLGEVIEVETSLSADLWPVFADANQLESSLLNLVVNARDAMPQGGKLLIETANVKANDPGNGSEIAEGVVLSVADTGGGIPTDTLERVFEPFFTTKETGKGSGLGLSMVHGFVSQSGGSIRITSAVGAGTTVKLYLPRAAEGARAEPVRRAEQGEPGQPLSRAHAGETILIVEDNENVRKYAVAALEELGYTVLTARDGISALRTLESLSPHGIDLLFTDIVLPGGMTGRALADEAARLRPGLPVLCTTGYSHDVTLFRERTDRSTPLILKPYDVQTLARKVRELLDARRQGAAVIPFPGVGPAV